MPDQPGPTSECPRCRQLLPAEEARCPHCGTLTRTDELTPLGGPPSPPPPPPAPSQRWSPAEERERLNKIGPVERAPGQEAPGSWGYLKFIVKQDPLFAVVLGLLALDVLVSLSAGSVIGAILPAAVLWGVYTFCDWGFWLAMIGAGFGLLMAVLSLAQQPVTALVWGAVFLFVIVVLYRRRELFG